MSEFEVTETRLRLRAALAVLEELGTVLEQFPELTDNTTKRGRAICKLRDSAKRELFRGWWRNEI